MAEDEDLQQELWIALKKKVTREHSSDKIE